MNRIRAAAALLAYPAIAAALALSAGCRRAGYDAPDIEAHLGPGAKCGYISGTSNPRWECIRAGVRFLCVGGNPPACAALSPAAPVETPQ